MLFGLFLLFFNKIFGHLTAEFQYKIFHIHFSEKGYQISSIIIGILFVIFGILSLFGIIKFK